MTIKNVSELMAKAKIADDCLEFLKANTGSYVTCTYFSFREQKDIWKEPKQLCITRILGCTVFTFQNDNIEFDVDFMELLAIRELDMLDDKKAYMMTFKHKVRGRVCLGVSEL